MHLGPDGQGVGYGKMLIRMDRALQLARMTRVPVFFVHPHRSLNPAIPFLQSNDVAIVPPYGWRARLLSLFWYAATPFRIGAPWLSLQRAVAQLVVGRIYLKLERATWLPARFRKWLIERGVVLSYLKRVNYAYGRRSSALWETRYKTEVIAPLREARQADRELPPVRLALPRDREARVVAEAARLGIDTCAPLVTVHVRESGFRTEAGLRQRGWDQVRNADVTTYVDAFAALVKRGYTVVRVGDRSMTPITYPGVIDFVRIEQPTAWLEVWCMLRSTFFIGCDSGPAWLAYLLNVPQLTVNAVHFRDLTRPTDRIICKLARDTATGRVLSVSEMLNEDFLRNGFKSGRYEYLDNSPLDIERAVLDMLTVVQGRERRSSAQDRFNRRLRTLEHESALDWSALDGVSILRRPRGTLSQGFAKRHFLPSSKHVDTPSGPPHASAPLVMPSDT